jgi:DNA-binding beta-propeller fold protein YncE
MPPGSGPTATISSRLVVALVAVTFVLTAGSPGEQFHSPLGSVRLSSAHGYRPNELDTHFQSYLGLHQPALRVHSGSISAPPSDSESGTIAVGGGPWGEAYDPANARLFVADFGANNMSVISTVTDSLISTIKLSFGVEWTVYDGRDGLVYVGDCCSQVYAINATTNQVVDTIALGAGCYGGCAPLVQAYDPENGEVYVVDVGTNNVTVISGEALVGIIPVGRCADGLGYDGANGDLYVSNECQDNLSIVNGSTNRPIGAVSSVQPGPSVVADTANGDVFVAGNNGTGQADVTVVSGATNRVLATIPTGNSSGDATYDPITGNVYVTQEYNSTGYIEGVSVINGTTDRLVGTIATQQAPIGIAYDDFNHELYVADEDTDNVSLILPSFSVEFHESGLAPGTPWSVSLNNMSLESNDTIVPFSGADGPYGYRVPSVRGYTFSGSYGSFQLAGENLTFNISFTPVTYSATFNESGLSNGTRWSILLDDSLGTSASSTLTFVVANGSYNYTVTPPSGYNATPRKGTMSIQASNKTVNIHFSAVSTQPPPTKPPPTQAGPTPSEWAVIMVLIAAAAGIAVLASVRRRRNAQRTKESPPESGETD